MISNDQQRGTTNMVNNGHSQAHGNASSGGYPTGHEENTA